MASASRHAPGRRCLGEHDGAQPASPRPTWSGHRSCGSQSASTGTPCPAPALRLERSALSARRRTLPGDWRHAGARSSPARRRGPKSVVLRRNPTGPAAPRKCAGATQALTPSHRPLAPIRLSSSPLEHEHDSSCLSDPALKRVCCSPPPPIDRGGDGTRSCAQVRCADAWLAG